MAVLEPYMVRTFEDTETIELEADSGESLLVKDIMVSNPLSDYATVRVGKTTVGYFRVGGTLGNHIHYPLQDYEKYTILGLLSKLGIFTGYPVAEGEKLTVDGVAQSGAKTTIVYEKHDAGDITSDMENGSKSENYMYINYGRISGTIGDGDNLYDISQSPSEFPSFPFGEDVPAGYTIDLYGILFSDVGKTSNTGANKQITKYIKLIKGRTVLMDEKRSGIPVIGIAPSSDGTQIGVGTSEIGNYSDVDRRAMWEAPEPMSFTSGEELNAFLTTEVLTGSANLTADETELGLILKVRKVA